MSSATKANNLLYGELATGQLQQLLKAYNMTVHYLQNDAELIGSFWGDPEAGLLDSQLYVKASTPLQSALHEACHYICMDQQRRDKLNTDAGGGYDEENGVCYLQILLASFIPQCGQARMMRDMDNWGYSFRLGSAKAWFKQDAEDARRWLEKHHIIDSQQQPTWQLRR